MRYFAPAVDYDGTLLGKDERERKKDRSATRILVDPSCAGDANSGDSILDSRSNERVISKGVGHPMRVPGFKGSSEKLRNAKGPWVLGPKGRPRKRLLSCNPRGFGCQKHGGTDQGGRNP